MKKITLFVGLAFFANLGLAEPGGYDPETAGGGGYDYLAVQKKEEQRHQDYLNKLERERKQKIRKTQAKNAATKEVNKKNGPDYVSKMQEKELCLAYGKALRGEKIKDPKLNFEGADKLVVNQVRANKMNVDYQLILKQKIQLDMSLCSLYASWGMPDDENRHVNRSGISIQHVYGRTYVYTDNGIVKSWQD